jgi:hypothetical protein
MEEKASFAAVLILTIYGFLQWRTFSRHSASLAERFRMLPSHPGRSTVWILLRVAPRLFLAGLALLMLMISPWFVFAAGISGAIVTLLAWIGGLHISVGLGLIAPLVGLFQPEKSHLLVETHEASPRLSEH